MSDVRKEEVDSPVQEQHCSAVLLQSCPEARYLSPDSPVTEESQPRQQNHAVPHSQTCMKQKQHKIHMTSIYIYIYTHRFVYIYICIYIYEVLYIHVYLCIEVCTCITYLGTSYHMGPTS